MANDWELGGESSGHIICRDVSTTGDGIVAALQVLKGVLASGKSLSGLLQGVSKYPQEMINVRVKAKKDTNTVPSIVTAVKASEEDMAGRGRVLLRASGTEPVIRVMVEGENADEVQQHVQKLAKIVEQEMV